MLVEPILMWDSLDLVTPVGIIDGYFFLWHLEPVFEVRVAVEVSLPSALKLIGVLLVKLVGLHNSEQSSQCNHFHISILL